jgi:hypothetical protein
VIVQVCASGGFKRESIRSARFETWPQSAALANHAAAEVGRPSTAPESQTHQRPP